jgi:hypothetical protein
VLSRAGPVNLAAALHTHARDPHRPWPPWESPSDTSNTTQGRRSPGAGSARPPSRSHRALLDSPHRGGTRTR